MNTESKRSLSVNAHIVTKEHNLLGEATIVDLREVKEAVLNLRFHNSRHSWPENVLPTQCT